MMHNETQTTRSLDFNFDGECDECGKMYGNLVNFRNAGVYLCKPCLDAGLMEEGR